jgi:hypothetical protein
MSVHHVAQRLPFWCRTPKPPSQRANLKAQQALEELLRALGFGLP